MDILASRPKRKAEVNIVPLVDVLTVLIFFFLLTMQFKEIYAVDITPPKMESSSLLRKSSVSGTFLNRLTIQLRCCLSSVLRYHRMNGDRCLMRKEASLLQLR